MEFAKNQLTSSSMFPDGVWKMDGILQILFILLLLMLLSRVNCISKQL